MKQHIGKVGDYVKMNPFTAEEARIEYGCEAFSGERKIVRVHDSRRATHTVRGQGYTIEGSNNWWDKYLLFKGVDYT